MSRARDAMERRWRESARRKKRGSGGLELDTRLKPLKLGTDWQSVTTVEELNAARDRKSRAAVADRQAPPPPPAYTPSFVLASPTDSDTSFARDRDSARHSTPAPPSPPYLSEFSPNSVRSSFSQPTLAPLPLSHSRPSLFKARNSTASVLSHKAIARVRAFSNSLTGASSSSPESDTSSFFNERRLDRTVDTEREEFPDIQSDWLSTRNTLPPSSTGGSHVLRPGAPPSAPSIVAHSPPPPSSRGCMSSSSRFTEDDDVTDSEDGSYDGTPYQLTPLPTGSVPAFPTAWAASGLGVSGGRLDPSFGGGASLAPSSIRSGKTSNNPFLRDPSPEPPSNPAFSSRANLWF